MQVAGSDHPSSRSQADRTLERPHGDMRAPATELDTERAAVLDAYFTNLSVEPVREGQGWREIDSLPGLWNQVDGE